MKEGRVYSLVLFTLILYFYIVPEVEGTHFRYGTISWFAANPQQPNRITFRVNQAWRRSFFNNPNVGTTFKSGTFCFGHNNICVDLRITASAINTADDWVIGTWTTVYDYPNSNANYIAWTTGCCRISTLRNNKDFQWRTETNVTINLTNPNRSPVSAGLPIVPVPPNTPVVTYTVPASDPDGDTLTFALSSASQMGSSNSIHPPGLTIDPTTGVVTFSTVGLVVGHLYCTQHIIRDSRGAYIPIDYILQITPQTKFCDPACETNPGGICVVNTDCGACPAPNEACLTSQPEIITSNTEPSPYSTPSTPLNGAVVSVTPGQPLVINFVAHDRVIRDQSRIVTIYHANIPDGSTMSNQIACGSGSQCNCVDCNNPQLKRLTWTPTNSDIGNYAVCVGVRGAFGDELSYGQHCVTISVAFSYCNFGTIVGPSSCGSNFDPDVCNCSCGNTNYDPSQRCFDCLPGFFGPNCQPCPFCNSPDGGSCLETILGSGQCACEPGYTGIDCTTRLRDWCDPSRPSGILKKVESQNSVVNPTQLQMYMNVAGSPPTGSFNLQLEVGIPTRPQIDVLILQDVSSGTTSSDISSLDSLSLTFINNVIAFTTTPLFGVATFDHTSSGYRRLQALTADSSNIKSRLASIVPSGVSSSTCGAIDAIASAATDSGLGWRMNSFKVIVVLTSKTFASSQTNLEQILIQNNIVPIFVSKAPSTYTTLVNDLKFGTASAALSSTSNNWHSLTVSAIQSTLGQVVVKNIDDELEFLKSNPLPSLYGNALGATVRPSVRYNYPSSIPLGTLANLPRITLIVMGWGSTTTTVVVNRIPNFGSTTLTPNEDQVTPYTLLGVNDPDNNLLEITYTAFPTPAQGKLFQTNGTEITPQSPTVVSLDGIFVPTQDFFGAVNVTFTVSDRCTSSGPGVLTFFVQPVNDPPTVTDFDIILDEDTSILIDFSSRINDVDHPKQSLQVYVAQPPSSKGSLLQTTGSTAIGANRLVNGQAARFVPFPNENGETFFTYYATDPDNAMSTIGRVRIIINPIPDPPVLQVPRNLFSCKRATLTSFAITVTDPDIGDTFTVSMLSNIVNDASHEYTDRWDTSYNSINTDVPVGSYPVALQNNILSVSGSGSIIMNYIPNTNAPDGEDGGGRFEIQAVDSYGLSSNIETIILEVTANSPPVLVGTVEPTVTNEEERLSGITIVGTDEDPEQGETLLLHITQLPRFGKLFIGDDEVTTVPFNVPISLRTNPEADHSQYVVDYLPNIDYFGEDSFRFYFEDTVAPPSGKSPVYSVQLTVINVNDPPTSASFTITTLEDTRVTITQFVAEDRDGDDQLQLVIIQLPSLGNLYLPDGTTIVSQDSFISLNNPGWSLQYMPPQDANGFPLTTFDFIIVDSENATSETYRGTINVIPVNDAPVTRDLNVTLDEDEFVSFVLPGEDVDDTDVFGIIVSIPPTFVGALYLDEEKTIQVTTGMETKSDRVMWYLPPLDAFSVPEGEPLDWFYFQVRDPSGLRSTGQNVVNLIVNSVNDPPVITTTLHRVLIEDTEDEIKVTATDDTTEPEGFKVEIVSLPQRGYLIERECGSCEETIIDTVPYTLVNEEYVVVFRPFADDNGIPYANFEIRVIDADGLGTNGTITIDVIPVNDPPVLIPFYTRIMEMYEDTTLELQFNGTDIDSPLESLIGILSLSPRRGVLYACEVSEGVCNRGSRLDNTAGSSFTIIPKQSDGIWRVLFVPEPNAFANNYATIGFGVIDDENARSAPSIVSIRVIPVNDPPTVTIGGPYQIESTETLTITNATLEDIDAGRKPIQFTMTTSDNTKGSLGIALPQAFRGTNPDCTLVDNVLNCIAPQQVLNSYMQYVTFTPTNAGTVSVYLVVNDLGKGAPVDQEADNHLTASASTAIFISAAPIAIIVETDNTLTYSVVGAAAGALAGAAILGAIVRRRYKKNDMEYFEQLFQDEGVLMNPLYETNNMDGENPLYETKDV